MIHLWSLLTNQVNISNMSHMNTIDILQCLFATCVLVAMITTATTFICLLVTVALNNMYLALITVITAIIDGLVTGIGCILFVVIRYYEIKNTPVTGSAGNVPNV